MSRDLIEEPEEVETTRAADTLPRRKRRRRPWEEEDFEEDEGCGWSALNVVGLVVMAVGGVVALTAALLDTTVPAGYGEHVHNLGLLAGKIAWTVIGCTVALVGAVFFAAPGKTLRA
jgi:hypothetical protein